MSLAKASIKAAYPLPAYNYRVTVYEQSYQSQWGDATAAACVIGCSEVGGLNVEYEPVTYKHGFSFVMGCNILPGMRQPIRITLKKGLTKGGDYLQKWLDQCYAEPYSPRVKRNLSVDLCDEKGDPVISWSVRGVLPVKLEAPQFTAGSQDVAIASMELVGTDMKVLYHAAAS